VARPARRSKTRTQEAIVASIRRQGKVRFLIIADGFQGWEKDGDWGDLSFQIKNDPHIEKMAIVGEKKWEDLALV
jgi:hypothetical protein